MKIVKAFVLGVIVAANIYAADPLVGTWKLNLQKSKLPPQLDVTEIVLTFEATAPDSLRRTEEFTRKNGEKTRAVITLVLDGKEHTAMERLTGKEGPGRTANFRRTDERHIVGVFKTGGRETGTNAYTLSDDGKTLTSIRRQTGADNQPD